MSYIQQKYVFSQSNLLSRDVQEREALEVAKGFHDPQFHVNTFLILLLHLEMDLADGRLLWVNPNILDLGILKDVKTRVLVRQLA